MDRIIKSYMDDFLKTQQIVEADESKQFELFASYCVVAQRYAEQFMLDDIVVGAGGDCGIDGIAIIANGTIITSKEEIDDLIEINKGLTELIFIFIQAKKSANFSGSEIGTFGAGVVDFFSDEPQFVRNNSIQEKSELVEYIFSKAVYLKVNPKCFLYYVTTGKWVNDQNCEARKNITVNDLNELNLFSDVQFFAVDSNLLQKYYRNTVDVVETEILFEDKILLPDIMNIEQAYLGYLDYDQYLKLITNESGDMRKNVFYDNVRDFQGNNSVNTEMSKTVKTDAQKFILLNNGVTIICKKLSNLRNRFTLTDYQIVNGCQTSHVLFNNAPADGLMLQIPVKIIETTDEETVNKIIKATNRQTEVTDEQLIALNEFHRRLEAFYNTFTGNQRLFYERRSKQYNYVPDIEKVRIVSISTQIKAAASMFFDKPHLASRYYGRLLKSVDGIFDEGHKMLPYYTCTYLLYKLEYLFRNKLLAAKYRKYRFHMLMMIKYDFSEGKISELNSNQIEKLCEKILDCAYDNMVFMQEIEKIIPLIEKCVAGNNESEITKMAAFVDDLKREICT